ncbi:Tetratricopeptide repeat [Carpediemonas membranifera]|uniref:Tetratricopeptide repeat n=1 Tax=Carpediemonas membranifera TaxID=201153 RepID=A0A8J6AZX6_9EUKA|nr:Tetratricopeptide repeat [Carpediemonas membranifera]|eukprot:KAG9389939.1 Tetratricopeptide repeat [Carpediemonas membranifera]
MSAEMQLGRFSNKGIRIPVRRRSVVEKLAMASPVRRTIHFNSAGGVEQENEIQTSTSPLTPLRTIRSRSSSVTGNKNEVRTPTLGRLPEKGIRMPRSRQIPENLVLTSPIQRKKRFNSADGRLEESDLHTPLSPISPDSRSPSASTTPMRLDTHPKGRRRSSIVGTTSFKLSSLQSPAGSLSSPTKSRIHDPATLSAGVPLRLGYTPIEGVSTTVVGVTQLRKTTNKVELVGGPRKIKASLEADAQLMAATMRRAGSFLDEMALWLNLAYSFDNAGEPKRALAAFSKALSSARQSGCVKGEILALNGLAVDFFLLNRRDQAINAAEQLVDIATDANSRFYALTCLGVALMHTSDGELSTSDVKRAHEVMEDAVDASRAVITRAREAEKIASTNLAMAEGLVGEFEAARESLDRSLYLADDVADTTHQIALSQLGAMASDAGQFRDADLFYLQARDVALENGLEKEAQTAKIRAAVARTSSAMAMHMANLLAKVAE